MGRQGSSSSVLYGGMKRGAGGGVYEWVDGCGRMNVRVYVCIYDVFVDVVYVGVYCMYL